MKKESIDMDYVSNMYNNMEEIWPTNDLWYTYTYKQIRKYIFSFITKNNITSESYILNVGSGGNTYDIPGLHFQTDIAYEKIKNIPNAYWVNAECLPFYNNFFDGGICVGSVINYCDPYKVIGEIARTLKHKAKFVLDFEQSKSFQFAHTSDYNADATIIESFNSGNYDKVWIFSEKYIRSIIKQFNLQIIDLKYFHILSPLLYRLSKNEQKATKWARHDIWLRHIPYIRRISCNIILTMQKV